MIYLNEKSGRKDWYFDYVAGYDWEDEEDKNEFVKLLIDLQILIN
ncbi:hypothetical protein [Paenibacillus sp. P46E]|nr:hypothetical protein [Paenibacillus sp. P46E]